VPEGQLPVPSYCTSCRTKVEEQKRKVLRQFLETAKYSPPAASGDEDDEDLPLVSF
jgi:hypothetical protein